MNENKKVHVWIIATIVFSTLFVPLTIPKDNTTLKNINIEEGSQRSRTLIVSKYAGEDVFHKITDAIEAAEPGDTIRVYAGEYPEYVIVDRTLTIIGNGTSETTIVSTFDPIVITADECMISGFSLRSIYPYYSGIRIRSDSNMIQDCDCSENEWGINLEGSNFTTIKNCTITSNEEYGIRISEESQGISITDSTINFNDWTGIVVERSNRTRIENCTLNNNGGGISFRESTDCIAKNNALTECGIGISSFYSVDHWNTHEIDTSNSVNGKPLYYIKNQENGTIPQDAGAVILAYCMNMTIKDLDLKGDTGGILVGMSSNCIITNVKCSDENKIWLTCSNNNLIKDCRCTLGHIGLALQYSNFNRIEDCVFNDNNKSPYDGGILLHFSNDNTIVNCISNNNSWSGINLYHSNENRIEECTLIGNGNSGVLGDFSHNNEILNSTCNLNGFAGISLKYSCHNKMANCSINSNVQGISLHKSSGTVYSLFPTGIQGCQHNTMIFNDIANNENYGVLLDDNNTYNSIYLNNFLDNNRGSLQAFDNGSDNKWDMNGLGNHWSDWQTPDIDKDGIVDYPYEIAGTAKSKDNFPIANKTKEDKDNDGVIDYEDMFPDDPLEWKDTDEDGIGDVADAFPDDPAASIDSDKDGHPDQWNPGSSELDSTTNLTRDHYPMDPDRWEEDDDDEPFYFNYGIIGIIILLIIIAISTVLGILYLKKRKGRGG